MEIFESFFKSLESATQQADSILKDFADNNPDYDFYDNEIYFELIFTDGVEVANENVINIFKGNEGVYKVQHEYGIVNLDDVTELSRIYLAEYIQKNLK